MHWAGTEILTFVMFSCVLMLAKWRYKTEKMQECKDGKL